MGGIRIVEARADNDVFYQFHAGRISKPQDIDMNLGYQGRLYAIPETFILPYLGAGDVPIVIGLAQSALDHNRSELRIGWGPTTIYRNTDFHSTSLAPIRQNLSGNTYDTLGAIMLQSKVKNGQTVNNLFALFTNGLYNGISAQEALKVFELKDLGVQVGADGVNTVSVDMSGGAAQVYAYWLESHMSTPDANKQRTEVNELKPCLIDLKARLSTPPFTWLEVGRCAARMLILPIRNQKDITGFYLNFANSSAGYGVRGIKFGLETKADLLSFATEYPVVTQGRNFNFDMRVQNTGSLVVLGFDVEIFAKAVDPNEPVQEVTIKNVHVDTANRRDSSETYPGATQATGAHTVYPMPDIMDAYNGAWAETTDYRYDGSSGTFVQTRSGVEYTKGLLPGSFGSYRTEIKAPQEKWHGQYKLSARITAYRRTTSLNNDGPKYDVHLNKDGTVLSAALVAGSLTWPTGDTAIEADYIARGVPNARSSMLFTATEYNDLRLEADVVIIDGKPHASINLSNPANA